MHEFVWRVNYAVLDFLSAALDLFLVALVLTSPITITLFVIWGTLFDFRFSGGCEQGGFHRWEYEGFNKVCQKCGSSEPHNPYMYT